MASGRRNCAVGLRMLHTTALIHMKTHLLNGLRCERTLPIKVLDYLPLIAVVRFIFTKVFTLEVIVIRTIVDTVIADHYDGAK